MTFPVARAASCAAVAVSLAITVAGFAFTGCSGDGEDGGSPFATGNVSVAPQVEGRAPAPTPAPHPVPPEPTPTTPAP